MTFTDFFVFDVSSNYAKSVCEEKINLQASFVLLLPNFKYTEILVFSLLTIV